MVPLRGVGTFKSQVPREVFRPLASFPCRIILWPLPLLFFPLVFYCCELSGFASLGVATMIDSFYHRAEAMGTIDCGTEASKIVS